MFTTIKIQHKVSPQIYTHRMISIADVTLVTDKGEEMPLKHFLERLEKFANILGEHELKLKTKEDPFEPSGAV